MQRDDDKRPTEMPARNLLPGHAGRGSAHSHHFVLLAIASIFLARILVLPSRVFDPDEFEHAHAAWCVFKGMLPYKDFFEHHTPFYYYALSPFFHWFHVDLSFESARHFLIFGRCLSVVLAILSVLLIIAIGRLLEDCQGSFLKIPVWAGLFLVVQPFFFHKMVEIRPDALGLPFFLGALWFLLRGLAGSMDTAKNSRWHFLGGGLCLGAAIMSTQKMLFVLPGLLAGLAIWVVFAGRGGGRPDSNPLSNFNTGFRSRVLLILAFLLGLCAVVSLTWAAFALHDGGSDFWANNFLLNAKWKHVSHEQFRRLLAASWPALILGLLGASVALYRFFRFFRAEPRRFESLLLLCTLFGLTVGILIVPGAHRQYYLMLLPIVCLFAAQGFSVLMERTRKWARPWLLVLVLVPLTVVTVRDLADAFKSRNDGQLAKLRYVFENTKPTDIVMDGIEGTGVFRPHALYHFFLHAEILDALPRKLVDAYVDDLERGKIRPRLIALDENLVALGTRFLRFVKRNYTSSDGFFYFSKGGLD